MVGGTIADMWEAHERGIPMATFSYAAFAGIALGPIVGGWIEMNPRLQWRWIQWIQLMYVFLPDAYDSLTVGALTASMPCTSSYIR